MEPAGPPRVNKAFGAPGTAGSVEAAMDPRTVWVNGAVGEPEVVGPAGSVWVTVSGEEDSLEHGLSPHTVYPESDAQSLCTSQCKSFLFMVSFMAVVT